MSEFKYACPVCGQHIKCDSSQAGSVMDCPTCFQKIVVPQPPANDDPKFILTGTQFVEKKIPDTLARAAAASAGMPEKSLPIAGLILVIAMLAAGAGAYFYFAGGRGLPGSFKDWRSGDIGNAAPVGNVKLSRGVCAISGSGADIWRQADAFHFVFQPMTGDGSLVAKILSVQNTHEWAKAGVMIRENTNASAAFALASVRADGQVQVIWRNTPHGEAAASALTGGASYPKWVKLTRKGNSFTAFYKTTQSAEWQRVGETQSIRMSPSAQVGLAVCSHNAGTLCQAQFDDVAVNAEPKTTPAAPPLPKPAPLPANDTNWTLTLSSNAVPDTPAGGRIHSQDFSVERATFQNGSLMLRAGTKGPVDLGVFINFSGAQPEAVSGKTINVTTNAEKAARVSLRWKDANGEVQKASFEDGYALRLEFGELANNRLPGKIYLCAPDAEKSYLLGAFNADARRPKPKSPQPPK